MSEELENVQEMQDVITITDDDIIRFIEELSEQEPTIELNGDTQDER